MVSCLALTPASANETIAVGAIIKTTGNYALRGYKARNQERATAGAQPKPQPMVPWRWQLC